MRKSFLCLLAAAALALPASAVDVASANNLRIALAQPAAGQEVQITFDATNLAGHPVDLDWQILVGTVQVGSGRERVAARARKGALARWTATSGNHVAIARVFPVGAGAAEDSVAVGNNEVRLNFTVSPASSTAPRELTGFGPKPLPGPGGAAPVAPPERRFLDMAAVRGAGFSTRLDTTLPGMRPCATAQRDASNPGPKNVMTTLDCRGLTPLHGQKADVDLYRGLQLRNGWRVRAARVDSDKPSSTSAGFKVNRIPQAGSTDVTSQLHLWAGPNDFIGTFLIVEIEGPAGTSPF